MLMLAFVRSVISLFSSKTEEYMKMALISCLILVLLLSISVGTAIPAGADVAGGSISGHIYESNGTTPISGATIIVNDFATGAGYGSVSTLPDGSYTLNGLPSGSFLVMASASGRVNKWYPNSLGKNQAVAVLVISPNNVSNINFNLEPGGSISGSVTALAGGIALANVSVFATRTDGPGGGPASTNGSGLYTISGLPFGTYRINSPNGSGSGDNGYAVQFYNNKTDSGVANLINISSAAPNASAINFALGTGGYISGTISTVSGPLANVQVNAYVAGTNQVVYGLRTKSDGTYTLNLQPGNYVVQARPMDSGLLFANKYYGPSNAYTSNLATVMSVSAGATLSWTNITLDPAGFVSGTVTTGVAPLANVTINAYDPSNSQYYTGIRTRADGTYILNLPAGNFIIQARPADSFLPYTNKYYNNVYNSSQATTLTVTAGNTCGNINFNLDLGGTITGWVYQSNGTTPIGGASIEVYQFDSLPGSWIAWGSVATTATDGSYTVYGLPSGQFGVRARCLNYASQWYNNNPYKDYCNPVTVTALNNTPNINFTLASGGSISGIVCQSNGGPPIAGVWVNAYDAANWRWINSNRTDSAGHYSISGLASGSYFLGASPSAGYASIYYSNSYSRTGAVSVSVAPPGDTSGINFSLEAGGTISGTITTTGGVPIANVSIDSGRTDGQGGAGANTDNAGNYTITGLPFGSYKVNAPSTSRHLSGDDNLTRKYYNNKADSGSSDLVAISAGAPAASGINFSLDVGGSISGHVWELNGVTPISGASVYARNPVNNNILVTVNTGADGSYTIFGLAPGSYRLSAYASGHVSLWWQNTFSPANAASVSVTPSGNTPNINFSLDQGGSISGGVKSQSTGLSVSNVGIDIAGVDKVITYFATTDASGQFYVSGLPFGQYKVRSPSSLAHNTGDDGFIREYYNNKPDFSAGDGVTISLTSPEARDINIALETGAGSLSGRVYQTDGITVISGARLQLFKYQDQEPLNVLGMTTDSSGYYQFANLAPGQYEVRAGAAGNAGMWFNSAGNVFVRDQDSPVNVVAAADTPNINFRLPSGGTISGNVFKADGVTPITGAFLMVYDAQGHFYSFMRSGVGGVGGNYTTQGLPAGNYFLRADAAGYCSKWYNNASSQEQATGISVTVPNDTPGINFNLAALVQSDVPLCLYPSAVNSIAVGQTFNMEIRTSVSGAQQVDGVDAYIIFDPVKLEVVDADFSQGGIQITPGASLTTVLFNTVDNTTGLVSFSSGKLSPPFPTGAFTVASIQFRAKAATGGISTPVTVSLSGLATTSVVDFGGSPVAGTHGDAAVQIIPCANVGLSVVLQGGSRPDSGWIVPLTVKFFPPGADVTTAVPAYNLNLTTAKSGSFAIAQAVGIAPATYDITVVTPTCLINLKRGVVVTAPSVEVNMGTLLEGNANDDNKINIQDFGILAATYGKAAGNSGFDARADFDRSGNINIADFGLLAANYGKLSPVMVP
jgi:hypothetical protein